MPGVQSHAPDEFNVPSGANADEIGDFDDALLELPESEQKKRGITPSDGESQGEGKQGQGQGTDPDPDPDSDDLDEDDRVAKVDQELRDAPDDATRAQIKERNKQNRLNQRQRSRQRIEHLERQLANSVSLIQDQSQRLARVEGGQRGVEYGNLQQQEQTAQQAEERLMLIIADATAKGDGNTVAQATSQLLDVKQYRNGLTHARTEFEREQQQPRRQPLNPVIMEHAKGFMSKNPWYKGPNATDEDSQIMATIDRSLVAQGWNPATPAYWQELEARGAKYLKHRFGGENAGGGGGEGYNQDRSTSPQQRAQRRSPVADGGGGGSQRNGGGSRNGQTMNLSADRVRALKEAGMWDNPEKRAKMVARYAALDRENANKS